MSVTKSIQAGNLTEAVATATADVKQYPTRPELRLTLAELMCFTGNLDRADTLVEAATKLQKGPAAGLVLFRQLLRGETARQQWYQEGRAPETRAVPTPEFSSAIQTIVEYRAGDRVAAAKLLAA